VLKEREQGAPATVLRVPILYGKTEYNAESAVNILRDGEWDDPPSTDVVVLGGADGADGSGGGPVGQGV